MKTSMFIFVCTAVLFAACSRRPTLPPLSMADSLSIIHENYTHRANIDSFFRNDPGSPFVRDTTQKYHGVNWFPINPRYRVYSVLHRHQHPDTVSVMGTKGEKRRQLCYGYFAFAVPGENGQPTPLKLNVYKFTPYDGQRYLLYKDNLSVWFTDSTTGNETYGVGRYVEIGNEVSDQSHVYTIDLNTAFNPYCAYSSMYSCAVPRDEDRLPIALRVGEMKYHE